MQKLWQLKLSWDESVPLEVHSKWMTYQCQLQQLTDLKITRRITEFTEYDTIQLHGFCDASQSAYGACIYIRTRKTDKYSVILLCSKSKVAPLKVISLPRLELCGALLLSRLLHNVRTSLNIIFEKIFLWTDSNIVLSWIAAPSNKWQTFVANRVSEIQQTTKPLWRKHVKTTENPADISSRGATPSELKNSNLWWHGPYWLLQTSVSWPVAESNVNCNLDSELLEQIKHRAFVATSHHTEFSIQNYSNYIRLLRIMAYILRFNSNTRITKEKRQLNYNIFVQRN